MAGYGNRRTEATSVASKIWAKALAIGSDEQHPCVLITVELIRAPGAVVEPLAERLRKKVGLERTQLAVCVTHTHTGPALASMLLDSYFGSNIPSPQQDRVKRYTERLLDLLEQVTVRSLHSCSHLRNRAGTHCPPLRGY